jgi:hypothetical protein
MKLKVIIALLLLLTGVAVYLLIDQSQTKAELDDIELVAEAAQTHYQEEGAYIKKGDLEDYQELADKLSSDSEIPVSIASSTEEIDSQSVYILTTHSARDNLRLITKNYQAQLDRAEIIWLN